MSHTKSALISLMVLTWDNDRGPAWWRLVIAVAQFAAALQVAWFIVSDWDVAERKTSRKRRTKEAQ